MKMHELLSDESKLCRTSGACDAAGIPVDPLSPLAVAWCLIGAARKCYGQGGYTIWQHLRIKILSRYPRFVSLVDATYSLPFLDIRTVLLELDV